MSVTELAFRHTDDSDTPKPSRWQPYRAGIVNVWRYYDEIFLFHNGRLLLRGPNGTGKSKALELLLPYLFDASLRPARLSTFGTSERSMHWNLMGDGYDGVNRVGYVWIEFHHPGDDLWFTCGARLQASTNSKAVSPTYFTTQQRIGHNDGLALVNDAGRPLTRADLSSAIGTAGTTYDSPADYRAAVRQQLFPGFSEQKYDALIQALLQLRTPKLSQHLDPAMLSTLLSHALPPLDHGDVAEIAEGFERLDRRREDLLHLDAEIEAAEKVASRQRTYARRVIRGASARVVEATSSMTTITRRAREGREKHAAAIQTLATLRERDAHLEQESADAASTISGITDREAYRQGAELDRLRNQAAAADAVASEASEQADRLAEDANADAETAAQAKEAAEIARQSAERSAHDSRHAASRAALDSTYDELSTQLDLKTARTLLRAAVDSRYHQLRAVRTALTDHAHATRERDAAEERHEAALIRVQEATSAAQDAQAQYNAAVESHADELISWIGSCFELRGVDVSDLVDAAADEPRIVTIVSHAAGQSDAELVRAESAQSVSLTKLEVERAARTAERDQLHAATEMPPPAPHTRESDRSVLPGSPLWRLVAFREGVKPDVQAAVEAGLEASGLLDAWLLPDGSVSATAHDSFVEAALAVPAPNGSLADILDVEQHPAVPAPRVTSLLAGIAFGSAAPSHPAAIGSDGTWRLGPAHGRWRKAEPVYIGAVARERARARRISELDTVIAGLDGQIAEANRALDTLAGRREALATEVRQRPDHASVAAALTTVTDAVALVTACQTAVGTAAREKSNAEDTATRLQRALAAVAALHRLPTTDNGLNGIEEALGTFRSSADAWLDDRAAVQTANSAASNALRVAERSGARAVQARSAATSRVGEARALHVRLATVESAVGAEYRELVGKVQSLRHRQTEISKARRALKDKDAQVNKEIGALETQCQVDDKEQQQATVERDEANERFRSLIGGHLLPDAGIGEEMPATDSTRGALDAARRVADVLSTIPHDPKSVRNAEASLAETVHSVQEALAGRADLAFEIDEDVRALSATVDGVRLGVAQLHKTLVRERDRVRADLTDDERKLFDKTLAGDTRRQLAGRIREANALVREMNARLERVRTASKVRVSLAWQIDPQLPAGTREARDLLLQDPVTLSENDRDALHKFFRDRIDEARATQTAENWEQQLLQVLDYRAWHQFIVKVDRGNGDGWQPVTRKLHGALSGGEKAIVLHLPLFAAAAAHYQSTPSGPRIILLDEVFVGVDTTNRGQLLELLVSLDLDLILTSDHEWCMYAELDGVAVHQLVTGSDGDDAVTTARFTWDGHRLQPDAELELPGLFSHD